MTSTTTKSGPAPREPSPKLARMLREAMPEQVKEATRIAANLLAMKNARTKD